MIGFHQDFIWIHFQWRGRIFGTQCRNQINCTAQVGNWINIHTRYDRCFLGVFVRQNYMLDQGIAREDGDWQCTFNWTNSTIKRKLTHTQHMNEVVLFSQITVGTEDSECDGKIETRALFANVRWRKVDSDSLKRKEESAVADGRADALARLAHRSVGQANYGNG